MATRRKKARAKAATRSKAKRGSAAKQKAKRPAPQRQAKAKPKVKGKPKAKKTGRRQSPMARVKRVAQEVAQQATTVVTEGVDALREMGGNLVDKVTS
jgi:hypothetical protein